MKYLLILLALLLMAGPLRRPLLGAWRFTVPAALGLAGGIALSSFLIRFGVPEWAMFFLPALFALQCGAVGKAWFDQNLGPGKE